MTNPVARQVYRLRLRRFRLQATLAVTRTNGEPAPEISERATLELAETLRELGALEQTHADLLPAQRLARQLGLDGDALDYLWALVARASDPLVVPYLRLLCGNDVRRGLSLGHFAAIVALPEERAQTLAAGLSADHPLRQNQLVVAGEEGAVDAAAPLTVPARLWSYLAGDDVADELLTRLGGSVRLPDSIHHDAKQLSLIAQLGEALSSSEPLVVILEGAVGAGRRTAVAAAAAKLKQGVYCVDAGRVPRTPDALGQALSALRRESFLRRAVPVVSDVDELQGSDGDLSQVRALARSVESAPQTVILTTSLPGLDLGIRGRRVLRLHWPTPDMAARRVLWTAVLGARAAEVDQHLDLVAHRYRLGPGGIHEAAAAADLLRRARSADASLEEHDLVEGIRNNIAEKLGELASRIEVKQSWADLVLAPETLDEIHSLVARVRHAPQVYDKWGFRSKMPRGTGVAGLFSGPPGTGKTMVAGLIARELDLELYQIDLSKVVSKWVGETEKQLARIFEAAEAGHALLLFDEADSLFAKRTEVKSATDRYANLEVNYLLQRIESFGGITLLTTNLDTSIDPALRRRLSGHVHFQAPEQAEAIELWKRMLSSDAPIEEELDFEELAERFATMAGANIRNAVLAAAFLAASEGRSISQKHLQRAGRGEYRAMGRVLG